MPKRALLVIDNINGLLKAENWLLMASKWTAAGGVALYLALPSMVRLLLLLMTCDFLTGLWVAYTNKKFDATIMRKGFGVKVLTLMIVALAHKVPEGLGLPVDLGVWVASAYSITEMFSIIENCARAGVPIPEVLIQAMVKVRPAQRTGQEALDELEGAKAAATDAVMSAATAVGKVQAAEDKVSELVKNPDIAKQPEAAPGDPVPSKKS